MNALWQLAELPAPRYGELSDSAQVAAGHAISAFLEANNYSTLIEACETTGLSRQELWHAVMKRSDLPCSQLPTWVRLV